MIWPLFLLVCIVGVLAAAAVEIALMRFRAGWSPRRRVFVAALAGPAVLFVGPFALIAAAMALSSGGGDSGPGMSTVVTIGMTATLAAIIGGLLAAYAIERTFQP